MKRAIIVMVKVPASGAVKTRLEPLLSGQQCRELATCFLKDTESKVHYSGYASVIAFSPPHKKPELMDILHHDHLLIEQKGNDLGERMLNAFRFAFDRGFESVVMIGTDSPTFPRGQMQEAFEHLEVNTETVIGKTEDGGYYLIGLNCLQEGIFDEVDWGSESAFLQTEENLNAAGLALKLVKTWYDVDYPEDLRKLKAELDSNPGLAPETAEWLKKIETDKIA